MAKNTSARLNDSFTTLKPYIERALTDEDFRDNVRAALAAAGSVYGGLTKANGIASASKLAGDKRMQEQIRRAFEELNEAGDRLKGTKKRSHKGRNTVLLAGFIVGVFYNPWTGPQTRQWLLDKIAGGDDLQPLESWDTSTFDAPEGNGGAAEEALEDAIEEAKSKS
jgi:hypothetical protein